MMRWGVFGGSSRIYQGALKPAFEQIGHSVVAAPSRNGDDFGPYDEMLARVDVDAVYNRYPITSIRSGATRSRRRQARAV
jgi:predicted dehydrogenase